MKTRYLVVCAVVVIVFCNAAHAGSPGTTWTALRSLVGSWEGVGSGSPGTGGGSFSFASDLDGKVIVRKSHSEYPASEGRPATVHDDLLVAYREDTTQSVRAIYFDNEGHVIHYTVDASPDGKTVTFVSSAEPSAPRYRLSYIQGEKEKVTIRFEIAPPGKADAFKMYLEGKAKRKE